MGPPGGHQPHTCGYQSQPRRDWHSDGPQRTQQKPSLSGAWHGVEGIEVEAANLSEEPEPSTEERCEAAGPIFGRKPSWTAVGLGARGTLRHLSEQHSVVPGCYWQMGLRESNTGLGV